MDDHSDDPAVLGRRLLELGYAVVAAIYAGDDATVSHIMKQRLPVLERLRELGKQNTKRVLNCQELREAALQEMEIVIVAEKRKRGLEEELQVLGQRREILNEYQSADGRKTVFEPGSEMGL